MAEEGEIQEIQEVHQITAASPPRASNLALADAPAVAPLEQGSQDAHRPSGASLSTHRRSVGRDGESKTHDSNNPFAFDTTKLEKLHDPRSITTLREMGGLRGLIRGLRTSLNRGLLPSETTFQKPISIEDVLVALERQDSALKFPAYDDEDNPRAQKRTSQAPSSIAKISNRTMSDIRKTFSIRHNPADVGRVTGSSLGKCSHVSLFDVILLCVVAVVSLALGFYQSFRPGATDKVEWVQGVAILAAVVIITVIQSLNDFQKERKFMQLNEKKEDRDVKVIRDRVTTMINIHDVLVGDIMHLEAGDIIVVDGVLVDGYNISCDESNTTGESISVRKVPADVALSNTALGTGFDDDFDPFILSGSKVLEGVGKFVVTAVGPNSTYGRTLMHVREEESEETPLQIRLKRVVNMIVWVGSATAVLLFIILFIKFLVQLPGNNMSASAKGQQFVQILIISVVVLVIAVPEGLPLAVTLALAYATIRMVRDKNLVRVLKACETMGNATTVCSDKTGTLTENKMTVVAATLGVSNYFEKQQEATESSQKSSPTTEEGRYDRPSPVPLDGLGGIPDAMKALVRQSIAINSTAFEGVDAEDNATFLGSKTEVALLEMAQKYFDMTDLSAERDNMPAVHHIPFNSVRKCMGVVVQEGTRYRLLVKGASEILLAHSNRVVRLDATLSEPLREKDRALILRTIDEYSLQSFRTIALTYRDLPQWPVGTGQTPSENEIFRDMTWICVVGIMDPLRTGVVDAVRDCQKAGVTVRMVTGDNINTAKAIATECGILSVTGIAMEGPEFRALTPAEKIETIPRLAVLARSSPTDKYMLVRLLKEMGQIVAVTGDGTNDGPALSAADVGFSMGLSGTEVAKEASDIVLMDDNFASIVKAILWGRCIGDAVKKFLQFQLTVNLSAVLLACISAIASDQETSVLTAVQLLWINLIQDTFAALALATDPPTLALLDRKPDAPNSSIITLNMWKMIIGQSLFQLIITLILVFAGERIFKWDELSMNTVIFNTYVWLQFFNQINCRRIDDYLNVFFGIHRNWLFITISAIIAGGQVLIISVGGKAFSVTRLDGKQWATSVCIGLASIPIGAIIRLIPNRFIERLVLPFWPWRREIENIPQDPNETAGEAPPNRPNSEPRQQRFGWLNLGTRQRLNSDLPIPLESLPGGTYAETSRLEEQPVIKLQAVSI